MRGALAAAAARPPGARFVFQHNDLLPSPLVARAVRAVARRADAVVALSRAIADDLDPDATIGVRVVHPGVDLAAFKPADHAAGAPPSALLLGAIVPWKRPDLALEAVAAARRTRPDLRLVVAGAPFGAAGRRLLQHLEARAQADDLAGAVEFRGPLEDPHGALREATVLLHCADREPFGMVMAEALASGRPVVAPAAGGPLEIVEPDCGALYRPADAAAAADALVEVLGRLDAGDPLAGRARARAEAAFDLRDARRRWAQAAGA
jgi:glycosyltransferase involved in cell wall biosynthesis